MGLAPRERLLVSATLSGIAVNALQVRRRVQRTDHERVRDPSTPAARERRSSSSSDGSAKSGAAAVDSALIRRLGHILQIIVPSWRSREATLLVAQTLTLLCRTLLSLRIARLGGEGLKAVVHRSPREFLRCLLEFAVTGTVAGVVNSALKFHTNMLTTRFRENLTRHVHERYCHGQRYYRAATLRGKGLDHLDQRVAEDVHQFCATLSDLHGRTFKPALDTILCTARMAQSMGWSGLAVLYGYYLSIGSVTRRFSPPFSRLIAQQAAYEGELRHCHSRLVEHAEEVALLDGGDRERQLLDAALARTTEFSRGFFLKQFYQGIADQLTIKYGASLIGWPVLALPFLHTSEHDDKAETVARYREADTLIQNACGAIGDLMLVYKKVQRLAGLTTRVSELLEALQAMEHSEAKAAEEAVEAAPAASAAADDDDSSPFTSVDHDEGGGDEGGEGSEGGARIGFDRVSLKTPDGRLLVKDLSLSLPQRRNLLVTGPNGAGKSSLMRALKGLWPLQAGSVRLPPNVHFVPQNAYLMSGTLRDQVIYPEAAAATTTAATAAAATAAAATAAAAAARDARVADCVRLVGLGELLTSHGLDAWQRDWLDVLSGGEKQRLGLARVLYHRPTFAVLDEATSAVNSDEQGRLHECLAEAGITLLSIAHRPEVKRYHHLELQLAGDGSGTWSLVSLRHE